MVFTDTVKIFSRSLGSVRFVCALRELLNRIPARVSLTHRSDPWVEFSAEIFEFPMIFDEMLSFQRGVQRTD